eukprot:2099621-Amphidinium_carterae.1
MAQLGKAMLSIPYVLAARTMSDSGSFQHATGVVLRLGARWSADLVRHFTRRSKLRRGTTALQSSSGVKSTLQRGLGSKHFKH